MTHAGPFPTLPVDEFQFIPLLIDGQWWVRVFRLLTVENEAYPRAWFYNDYDHFPDLANEGFGGWTRIHWAAPRGLYEILHPREFVQQIDVYWEWCKLHQEDPLGLWMPGTFGKAWREAQDKRIALQEQRARDIAAAELLYTQTVEEIEAKFSKEMAIIWEGMYATR